MILRLQSRLADATRDAVRAAYGVELDPVTFQYPPRLEMGDLALTAPFDLARTLRQKPRDIAARLADALGGLPDVRQAEVAGGGYVNLFLRRDAVARELYDLLRDPLPPARTPEAVLVSTPASTRTRPPTSVTCATPPWATRSCACSPTAAMT